MKVSKYIPKLIDIDIQKITLLSLDEYKTAKERIEPINNWWWLCSPGNGSDNAAYVYDGGSVNEFGFDVGINAVSVRPALRIKSENIQIGDRFSFGNYDWTVITDNLALCNTEICKMAFRRRDWKAEDANIYEKSDIKKYLDEWLEERKMTYTERKNRKFGDKE